MKCIHRIFILYIGLETPEDLVKKYTALTVEDIEDLREMDVTDYAGENERVSETMHTTLLICNNTIKMELTKINSIN